MRVGVYHPLRFAPLNRFPARYTSSMSVILLGMRLLEVMFFAGIAGSAVVVLIASVEDARELFSKSDHVPPAEKTPAT
jgi:hypothetical protein